MIQAARLSTNYILASRTQACQRTYQIVTAHTKLDQPHCNNQKPAVTPDMMRLICEEKLGFEESLVS
ncbi:unnamed protein product [Protopolystoma xenopodis]|uniref:Uncharacterized protein n=1 Tax=Protopolystoma xenopodis TaxID=117903 RepID=A0A448WAV5_9PLAT|nr:unnamed protein product [Protopolystoma xenopodis]